MIDVQVERRDHAVEKPQLPELGAPGTVFWRGFIQSSEYVPELIGKRALDIYDRMRRSDGMTAGTLRALKLPLEGATWGVGPASADAADVEIAAFVGDNLFEGMTMTWQEHLRHVLTHLDFGFYVCEKVWEIRDGRVRLRKLAPRLQRTIDEWELADDGGLIRVIQRVYGGTPKTARIPVEKLLVFSNDKEGADFQGKSVLRPAYKHWFIKDQLDRIYAIAVERNGVGIPVMKVDGTAQNDTNMKRAEDIVKNVAAHEQAYVVEVEGTAFRFEGLGSGKVLDPLQMIQRHERLIGVSMLAQFLALGAQALGSYALSEDHSTLFLRAERAIAEYICDIHNRHLIPQLVDFNFSGVRRYPKLTCSNIETRNAEKLLNALTPAVNVGLITADAELEDALRARLDLPRRDGTSARPRPVGAPTPAPAPEEKPPAAGGEPPRPSDEEKD